MRVLYVLFIFSSVIASQVQDDMVRELAIARYNLSIKYAPKEWKKELFDWDLNRAFEQAKTRVYEDNCVTSKDFQKVFKEFLATAQDYHVRAAFYSTELALYPLFVRGVDGRYFFQNPLFDPDIKYGDELIAISGVPVAECIEKLIDEDLAGDRSPTGYALAEKKLFIKIGKLGDTVPSGAFTVTIRSPESNEYKHVSCPWIHVPEQITNRAKCPTKPFDPLMQFTAKDYSVSLASDLKAAPLMGQPEELDMRLKSFVPKLGEIICEYDNDNRFGLHAYLYRTPSGKKVGYLYLPSFLFFENGENVMEEIGKIIAFFEEESEALVVDINDNEGGNLLFTYGVLSALTDHPIKTLFNRETLTQEDAYRAAELVTVFKELEKEKSRICLHGYFLDRKDMIAYASDILSAWNRGMTLTDPLPMFGISAIEPHPTSRYSKPILLLTNELCFSCADVFAALLQDSGRATLFGKTTAGAGGNVQFHQHMSRFGIKAFGVTRSMLYRKDGTPLESVGVTPDIPYEFTQRDLTENFADYIEAVNAALDRV